jgi:hypothetical protein
MKIFVRGMLAGLTLVAVLVLAPAAQAGTIRYSVTPDPAFTVKDNGNGLVKVTYNGCVTAGVQTNLTFQMVVSGSNKDGTAGFKVLQEAGENPSTTFNPPSVFVPAGDSTTIATTLSFTLTGAEHGVNQFRIKLDPDPAQGLGEGPGIDVRIPCVVQPGSSLPSPNSIQARASAPCVSTPQDFQARAGEKTRVLVRVKSGGQRIGGALVRIAGAGVSRSKHTDRHGEALFTIKPTRSGRIVIQSNVCFGADRFSVLGERRSGRVSPEFTG